VITRGEHGQDQDWISCRQRRLFIFGALGYFNRGPPEGLRLQMSYKSVLHVLATIIEQVVTLNQRRSRGGAEGAQAPP